MIIRRRHTAHFTTIGNALFEDERLAADEVGVLAFLLSKPHDWQVRRPGVEPSGWHFQFNNESYPDVDDTAFVLMALQRVKYPDAARMESAAV